MDTALAWIVTTVIFGTLTILGVVTALFVRSDWQRARVSRVQIITALTRYVLPVHGVFTGTIVIGWLQRPLWWPPHGPDIFSLVIPCVAVGMADVVLAAVLLCVWPTRLFGKS